MGNPPFPLTPNTGQQPQEYRQCIGHQTLLPNIHLRPASFSTFVSHEQVAEPTIRAVLEENARQISDHRGELAAIVQYVYSLAASRVQPFLRGALARRRLPNVHWEMLSYVSVNCYRYATRGSETTCIDCERSNAGVLNSPWRVSRAARRTEASFDPNLCCTIRASTQCDNNNIACCG